jgi:predicted ATPase
LKNNLYKIWNRMSSGTYFPPPVRSVGIPKEDGGKRVLIKRTEGNPFFLEESVQELVETRVLAGGRGAYRLDRAPNVIQIPATVQAVLAARIDRLAIEDKVLLQTAAVVGKDVPFPLLQAVADQPEDEVRRGIARLQTAEFLYEAAVFPDLAYTFKHALTREVAYGSLLQERRRFLHRGVMEAIEKLHSGRFAEHLEHLAHHAYHGAAWERAVTYLHQAGTKAAARSAYSQAIACFEQALVALRAVPEMSARSERELTINIALATALQAVNGYAAPEVERVYVRARELCDETADLTQRVGLLSGVRVFYHVRGEFHAAREVGEEALALARLIQSKAVLSHVLHGVGHTLYSLGEFVSARAHTEEGIAVYVRGVDPSEAPAAAAVNPGVSNLVTLAWVLWYTGYPETALTRVYEGVNLARQAAHAASLEQALASAAIVHQLRREASSARQRAEEALAISREHGFIFRAALNSIFLGWAMAVQGSAEQGIALIIEGLTTYRVTGAEAWRHHYLALLAEAQSAAGRIGEGLTAVAEGLAVLANDERYYAAELYRIRGELLLAASHDNRAQAQGCFEQALDIARRQEAKSLELRAAVSLARLWAGQGRRDEGRQLLAGVYGWFSEGFQTSDLCEARTLLAEL